MLLEEDALAVVADFLLKNDGVVETLERRAPERPSRGRSLTDTLSGRVREAPFIMFDLHAKEVALRVDQEITFQKQSRFGGVWNDGVRNADGLPVVQDLFRVQLSQRTETGLLIQFDRGQCVKGSRDPLEEGHRSDCAPSLLDTASLSGEQP